MDLSRSRLAPDTPRPPVRSKASPLLLLLFFAAAIASPVQAAVFTYFGHLDGATVQPPNASTGTGYAELTYDSVSHQSTVELDFTGLVSTDIAAHLHCCVAPPANVGVAIPLAGFPVPVTAGSYVHTFSLIDSATYQSSFLAMFGGNPFAAEAAFAAGLDSFFAYVDIHTSTFPAGEIRAQLRPTLVFVDGFASGDPTLWTSWFPVVP